MKQQEIGYEVSYKELNIPECGAKRKNKRIKGAEMRYRPIQSAPRNESKILIFHLIHGWVQARFIPLTKRWHPDGYELDGCVWIIGDDLLEELSEVTECGGFRDPNITHWMPLPELPASPKK